MLSIPGISPTQTETFLHHYQAQRIPLRAAAQAAGLNIIQATLLARHAGCLRITEAAIINSKQGEIGRIGEDLFQQHLPEAINTNLSVAFNHPGFDFLLGTLRIDIKTSSGSAARKGSKLKKYRFRCDNKSKTDVFVLFVQQDTEADSQDPATYSHCFVIPSLHLLNHLKLEICADALTNPARAWHDFAIPINRLSDTMRLLAAHPEAIAVPPELMQAVEQQDQLKKHLKQRKKGSSYVGNLATAAHPV